MCALLAPAAAGAASTMHRALRRRQVAASVSRRAEDAIISKLFEQTPVLLMKVDVRTANLQEALRGKSLRVRVKFDDKELFATDSKKAEASEAQCARFDFNTVAQFMLQGDGVLTFEVLQPHPVLPSKTLARAALTLSEIREALGGGALTDAVGRPLTQELLLIVPKKSPEEVLGCLQVDLAFERSTLADASHLAVSEVERPSSAGAVREEQVILTADGGQMTVRSFLCPSTGKLKTEAVRTDADGCKVERVEWDDDEA